MMKKCCHCRKDLPANSGITCEKCKRNEMKYGKPTTCKYCQLPAAFLDAKCVHCSYSERKHGLPVPCSKCKLKCAFPKDPSLKDKHILCRLCSQQDTRVSKSNSYLSEKIGLKRVADESFPNGSYPSTSKKSREGAEKSEANVYAEHHVLTVQQLKDNILELNRSLRTKDQSMQEKDRKIAELNAELLRQTKDYRNKITQLQKQNSDMTEPLREQIKTLSKQISQMQKANKNSFQPLNQNI